MTFAVEVDPEKPVLIDKYLDRAIELDVDALCDVKVGGGRVVDWLVCVLDGWVREVRGGVRWAHGSHCSSSQALLLPVRPLMAFPALPSAPCMFGDGVISPSSALNNLQGNVVIAGIMEHIEQAGIHSGDSACSLPTQSIPEKVLDQIRCDLHARACVLEE